MPQSRIHAVGPLAVCLVADDPALVEAFAPLLAGFQESAIQQPVVVVKLSETTNPTDVVPQFQAELDGHLVGPPGPRHQVEIALTRGLNRAVLDAEDGLLHLHAGAVTRQGVSVLVIGSSFAGKSTLVAKLVSAGWQYLSDEQVAVSAQGLLVPFQRPITLRRDSWPLFDEVNGLVDESSPTDRVEVQASTLGAVYHGEPVAPTLIVRPDVSTEGSDVQRLSIAEAMSVLVEDSLDMERAGIEGLDAMVAVVTAAPAYRVSGKDLDRTLAVIEQRTNEATAPGAVSEHEAVLSPENSCRAVGSQGWLFPDGSSALYEFVTGSFVRVDEAGFRAWQMLASAPDTWPPQMHDSAFLAQLRTTGFVTSKRS